MKFGRGRAARDFTERLRLYEKARSKSTWRPDVDIDWEKPSILKGNKRELAHKIACTGTYTEEIGLFVCARLLQEIDDLPARYALALQISDEAKHSEVFTRYIHVNFGEEPPPPTESIKKISDDLSSIRTPEALFFVHTALEGFASDQFSFLMRAFRGDTLHDIYKYVLKDEVRHINLGIEYLVFALHQGLSEQALNEIQWCEANIRMIGFVNSELMTWLSEISGAPAADIAHVFEKNHQARLQRIWKGVRQ
ncbi:hypothetical protein [Nitrospirillum sp. BR 11163]|uniref:hypothetical protein n=1 Tax=Nitrospirillum sp. BR 11163 TaxID=3104323 RepID=UPI002AFF3700|nr:hypothetical protein [Nitrospirillum sp. BR 11163]MEA1671955.1 hypothetical protein [Nitrospirillum sp. BR 11163]